MHIGIHSNTIQHFLYYHNKIPAIVSACHAGRISYLISGVTDVKYFNAGAPVSDAFPEAPHNGRRAIAILLVTGDSAEDGIFFSKSESAPESGVNFPNR